MFKRMAIALVALFVALASSPVFAQLMGSGPSYWGHGYGWGHMLIGFLIMLVFLGGLIFLIVLAVRWLGRGSAQRGEYPVFRKSALNILEERFARGEIGKEEFEERKRLLSD
jgi:putative membrane protein